MSRISCDVTKDLLPCYLDEICSEESKELVEEHLKECAECNEFLGQLKERDLGKDAPKVDYMKKTRRHMLELSDMSSILIMITMLTIVGLYFNHREGVVPLVIYYMGMAMLMVPFNLAFINADTRLPVGKEWCFPLLAFMTVGAAAGVQYLMVYWIAHEGFMRIPIGKSGPLLYFATLLTAILAVALWIVLYLLARRKGKFFLISYNLSLLGAHLALSLTNILRGMDSLERLMEILGQNAKTLLLEFGGITLIMLLIGCRKGRIAALFNPDMWRLDD